MLAYLLLCVFVPRMRRSVKERNNCEMFARIKDAGRHNSIHRELTQTFELRGRLQNRLRT